MAHPFDVDVVSADRRIFTGQAVSVVVPATDGYLGILTGHAPLVAGLAVGRVTITPPGGALPLTIAVSGGFVEVAHDRVIILADTAELSTDIDVERARLSVQRAEERLRAQTPEIDVDRAKAALLRALNRLNTAEGRSP